MKSNYERLKVNLPEGAIGRVAVERFEIPADSTEAIRMNIRGRGTSPGHYTRLMRNGELWMSDTDAERRDHLGPVHEMMRPEAPVRRVLINGLGLGMIVNAALTIPSVQHIDVVEIDPDVCALVGPHYEASGRVKIHCADAYEIEWPKGTRWDVAWHDVWRDLCLDNLPLMAKLHRKYGRRVGWQGSWGKAFLESEKRRDRFAIYA